MAEPTYQLSNLPARLASKIRVDLITGCWLWVYYCDRKGYGRTNLGREKPSALVHRVVYMLLAGPIPEDKPQLDHVKDRGCIHPNCCWPAHLEPVTNRENMMRGDTFAAHKVATTHCPKNHPLVPGNLRGGKRLAAGHRECLTCHRERERARYQARRA